jgi:mannose-6-phosphate isomerase-like protein (cupin superfamily)
MKTELELKRDRDYVAPDGSEIYRLVDGTKGGLCQCILPAGATGKATSHKTVEELWFFLEGRGEVYRRGINDNKELPVGPGMSLVIPSATVFQFRNTGEVPLKFLIATMPVWPGEQESNKEVGIW